MNDLKYNSACLKYILALYNEMIIFVKSIFTLFPLFIVDKAELNAMVLNNLEIVSLESDTI